LHPLPTLAVSIMIIEDKCDNKKRQKQKIFSFKRERERENRRM
jgi:hypothetical protein